MWPNYIVERFKTVPQNSRENDFYAPYNKLLCSEFPVDSKYTVAPQSYPVPSSRDSIDFVIEYLVLENDLPVFILEIKEPSKINLLSSRQEADIQMRKRLRDLVQRCPIDKLNGVSAFGSQLSFYSIDKHTMKMLPPVIPQDIEMINDTAPIERWNTNLLDENGSVKLQGLFRDIKNKCNDF